MQRTPLDIEALLKQHDMIYEAAPLQWEQGRLLGNGNLGAVIWGDGAPTNFALNRMDAWDQRDSLDFGADGNYQTLRKLLDQGQVEEAAGSTIRAKRSPIQPMFAWAEYGLNSVRSQRPSREGSACLMPRQQEPFS